MFIARSEDPHLFIHDPKLLTGIKTLKKSMPTKFRKSQIEKEVKNHFHSVFEQNLSK